MTLQGLEKLAKASGYNSDNKGKFEQKARAFLKSVVKALKLNRDEYQIRFNSGGIAVSGDAILHTNTFYFTISDFGHFWRHCKGQKDYGGQWGPGWENRKFKGQTVEEIALEIQKSYEN